LPGLSGATATKLFYQRMTKSDESTAGSPFVSFYHSLEKSTPAKFVFKQVFGRQQYENQ
jgi:hypothetical protein